MLRIGGGIFLLFSANNFKIHNIEKDVKIWYDLKQIIREYDLYKIRHGERKLKDREKRSLNID